MRESIEVFTDGACLGNPGPGGWAWAVPGGRFASGAEAHTTNQRMEIHAVLDAVRTLDGPLEVVSDSTYVVNCFRDRWWESWIARGWLTSAKKPVANRDLWEPLIAEVRRDPTRIAFRWVKGHSGDVGNDLVDRLAVEAARTQQGRTGEGTPTDLGAPDEPRGSAGVGAAIDPRLPAGHLVAVTGHRPPELGGYDPDNPVAKGVRDKLTEILAAKRVLHPDLGVLTGLGLGAEQLAAEAAIAADITLRRRPPLSRPRLGVAGRRPSPLPASSSTRPRRSSSSKPSSPPPNNSPAAALRRRDAWLARHAHEAIVVWDGKDATVGRTVRALQDALGEDEVWVVSPPAG